MAKINYEELWNATENTKHKELLLEWAKETNFLRSDEDFEFVLPKVVELNDDDVIKVYASVLAYSFQFFKRIKDAKIIDVIKDKIIAFVLEPLYLSFITRNEEITSFRYLLDNPNYPNTQRVYKELQTKVYDKLMVFIDYLFKSGVDLETFDVQQYFNGMLWEFFALTLLDENKRFLDLMFENKDHEHLSKLYRILELMEQKEELDGRITSMIKKSTSEYFANFSFTRSTGVFSNEDRDNYLMIRMANYVDFGDELSKQKTDFFLQLGNVFEDIIDNRTEKYQTEIVRHFNQLNKLNDDLLRDFVDYLQLHQLDIFKKIHRAIKKIAKDHHQPFPPRISELFENKKVAGEQSKSDEKSEDKSDHELNDSASSEQGKPVKKTKIRLKKRQYFDADLWDVQRGFVIARMLNSKDEVDTDQIETALNNIAEHARKHLNSDGNSDRAKAGRQKYQELVDLFEKLSTDLSRKTNSGLEGLERARDTLAEHLDQNPKDSELLKNRGGFFGAYISLSKCLSAVGLDHFKYKERTSVSTTDHLLIVLFDEMNNLLVDSDQSDASDLTA